MELTIPSSTIVKKGFIYIFVSNESNNGQTVYFDDLKIEHIRRKAAIQQDDYYPFGLSFNSWKRTDSLKNKLNTFQNQELIDALGIDWVQFKWRNHMPEIGRFFNVDPLAEDYYYNSPYAFSENKVVAHVELEGLEAQPAGKGNSAGTTFVYYVGNNGFDGFGLGGHTSVGYYGKYNYINNKTLYLPLSGYDGKFEMRKFGSNKWHEGMLSMQLQERRAWSEAQTIQHYLDGGEIVQRMHYAMSDKDMKNYWTTADSQWINPNTADVQYCTQLAFSLFEKAWGTEIAKQIIYYSLPEELSKSEAFESGSIRCYRFYMNDGKYYHDLYIYESRDWIKYTYEIENFETYFSNENEN